MVCLLLAAGFSKNKRTVNSYLNWWIFVGSFKFSVLYSSDKKPQDPFCGGGSEQSVEIGWTTRGLPLKKRNALSRKTDRNEYCTIPRSMMSLVRDHFSKQLASSAALSHQWQVVEGGWRPADTRWRVSGDKRAKYKPPNHQNRVLIYQVTMEECYINWLYIDPSKIISISRCINVKNIQNLHRLFKNYSSIHYQVH